MRVRGNCIRPDANRAFSRPFSRGFSADTGAPTVAQRHFPDSAGTWAAAFPSLPTPLAIWTFQEAASPVDDKIGTNDQVVNAGATGVQFQQTGDTEPTLAPRHSVNFSVSANTEFFQPADLTFGNIPAGGIRFLLARFSAPVVAATAGVCGKGSSVTTARWAVRLSAAGLLQFMIGDGTTSQTVASTSEYDDGNYHDIAFGIDGDTADSAYLVTESEDVSAALVAGLATTINASGLSPSQGVRFGHCVGSPPIGGLKISYAALFDARITAAHLAAFRTAI